MIKHSQCCSFIARHSFAPWIPLMDGIWIWHGQDSIARGWPAACPWAPKKHLNAWKEACMPKIFPGLCLALPKLRCSIYKGSHSSPSVVYMRLFEVWFSGKGESKQTMKEWKTPSQKLWIVNVQASWNIKPISIEQDHLRHIKTLPIHLQLPSFRSPYLGKLLRLLRGVVHVQPTRQIPQGATYDFHGSAEHFLGSTPRALQCHNSQCPAKRVRGSSEKGHCISTCK